VRDISTVASGFLLIGGTNTTTTIAVLFLLFDILQRYYHLNSPVSETIALTILMVRNQHS
jgi:putative flippase GtrA